MHDLRTYRAKSIAEALRLVREDLGPEASLLHTRHVNGGLWQWMSGGPEVEVTASLEVQAPSRLTEAHSPPRADEYDFRSEFRAQLHNQNSAPLDELAAHDWPE